MSKTSKNTVENTADKKSRTRGLIPWKKGDPSPNPKGHPKGQRNFATIYREALVNLARKAEVSPEEYENQIIEMGIKRANSGDHKFYQDLHDRIHGKAVVRQEITGKDGEALIPDSDSRKKSQSAINEILNGKNKGTRNSR